MTYVSALTSILSNENIPLTDECRATLTKLTEQLQKRKPSAESNEKRKAATAAKRAALVATVIPVITDVMPKEVGGEMTAKEIWTAAQSKLPEDFTAAKVQNVLLRELADRVDKIERKGKPNLYRLK